MYSDLPNRWLLLTFLLGWVSQLLSSSLFADCRSREIIEALQIKMHTRDTPLTGLDED